MQELRSAAVTLSLAIILFAIALPIPPSAEAAAKEYLVYVGTYTREESKGIYAYRFDPTSGKVTSIGLVAETPSPSFLAVHPNQQFLYAVNETSAYQDHKTGSVTAFLMDRSSGRLMQLNQVASRGTLPCHLAVDQTGKSVLVANYGTGSTAVFPVAGDGRLGEASGFVQHSGSSIDPRRQEGPHAHGVVLSADNRFAFVPDLGTDQVLIYRLDPEKGSITSNDPAFARVKAGGGPRHFAFHPSGNFAYANNEMGSSVSVFSYDAQRGALTELQLISTLPAYFSDVSHTAEIEAHPSGKFLYVSNRGHDSLAVFAIDLRKGTLTAKGHVSTQGKTPRNFAIDPTGTYLFAANQNSDTIVLFRVDEKTGQLTPTGDVLSVDAPVSIVFVPAD